jgi:hypothetical protein
LGQAFSGFNGRSANTASLKVAGVTWVKAVPVVCRFYGFIKAAFYIPDCKAMDTGGMPAQGGNENFAVTFSRVF